MAFLQRALKTRRFYFGDVQCIERIGGKVRLTAIDSDTDILFWPYRVDTCTCTGNNRRRATRFTECVSFATVTASDKHQNGRSQSHVAIRIMTTVLPWFVKNNSNLTLWRPLLSLCVQLPDRVVVICNFWHPGTLTLRADSQSVRMSNGSTWSDTGCFMAVLIIATVGVKGLN